jgi:hypothetical protein
MSNAEQLADAYARGKIDGMQKCCRGKRTKAFYLKNHFGDKTIICANCAISTGL